LSKSKSHYSNKGRAEIDGLYAKMTLRNPSAWKFEEAINP
jgi:hypothetical protein